MHSIYFTKEPYAICDKGNRKHHSYRLKQFWAGKRLFFILVIHLLFGMKSRCESFQFLLLLFVLSNIEMMWQYILSNWEWQCSHLPQDDHLCLISLAETLFTLKGTEDHTESDRRLRESFVEFQPSSPSFLMLTLWVCQCRLNQQSPRAKPKSQGSSDSMDFFIICG